MHVGLIIALCTVVAVAAYFILSNRTPSSTDAVSEKIRPGKDETVAAIDPLTGQLLVEPTEDLLLPGTGCDVIVSVNRETAQRYRLDGLEPFRKTARMLSLETRARVICWMLGVPPHRFVNDPAVFYGWMLGDGAFEEAFDSLVARTALIDRYAGAVPDEREHDELMVENSDLLEEYDVAETKFAAWEAEQAAWEAAWEAAEAEQAAREAEDARIDAAIQAQLETTNEPDALIHDFDDEPTEPSAMSLEAFDRESFPATMTSKSVDPFSSPEPDMAFNPFEKDK